MAGPARLMPGMSPCHGSSSTLGPCAPSAPSLLSKFMIKDQL